VRAPSAKKNANYDYLILRSMNCAGDGYHHTGEISERLLDKKAVIVVLRDTIRAGIRDAGLRQRLHVKGSFPGAGGARERYYP
jgi:hypothetical protein